MITGMVSKIIFHTIDQAEAGQYALYADIYVRQIDRSTSINCVGLDNAKFGSTGDSSNCATQECILYIV